MHSQTTDNKKEEEKLNKNESLRTNFIFVKGGCANCALQMDGCIQIIVKFLCVGVIMQKVSHSAIYSSSNVASKTFFLL